MISARCICIARKHFPTDEQKAMISKRTRLLAMSTATMAIIAKTMVASLVMNVVLDVRFTAEINHMLKVKLSIPKYAKDARVKLAA